MEIPNINSTNIPAPASPEAVPGVPNQTPLSQEGMKSNLKGMMGKIEGKYQDFNSQKFASDNKVKEAENDSLRKIFDLFESVGVNPSNPKEVIAFLDKIKTENPELSKQLEATLSSLMGGDTEEEIANIQETSDVPNIEEAPINMNMNNEAPQKNI